MLRRLIAGCALVVALTFGARAEDASPCLTDSFDQPRRGSLACMKELEALTFQDEGFMVRLIQMAGFHLRAGDDLAVVRHYIANKLPELSESRRLSLEALVRMVLRDHETAMTVAQRAARLDATNAESWHIMGVIQTKNDQQAAALRSFYKALQADPDHIITLKYRALVFGQVGKIARAIGDVNRALNLTPEDTNLYQIRADLLLRRGRAESDDHNRALDDLNTILRFEPDNHVIQNRRGVVLFRQGRPPDALRHLMKAVELEPEEPRYLTNTATVLMFFARRGRSMGGRIGDPKVAAISHIQRAIDIEPTASRFSTLAAAQMIAGDMDKAATAFDKAARMDEKYAKHYQRNLKARNFFEGGIDAPWGDASRAALNACLMAGCDPRAEPAPKKGQGT